MSGDMEDFLRRAAERRQAKIAQEKKAAQSSAGRPANKSRPEYSDRKAERQVRRPADDEVSVAEIVEAKRAEGSAPPRKKQAEKKSERAVGQPRDTKRSQSSANSTQSAVSSNTSAPGPPLTSAASEANANARLSEDPAHQLLRLLRQPGGMQQAILLKEILDRPVHRW
jgi:hypothetical protein